MTPTVTKTVTVRLKNDKGENFNPIRVGTRDVQTFDLDYGRARRERQENEREGRLNAWQARSPEQQLSDLDARLGVGVGASKQRAKIAARIQAMKQERPAKTVNKPQQKAKHRNQAK